MLLFARLTRVQQIVEAMKRFIVAVVVLSVLICFTDAWELTLYNKANYKGLEKNHRAAYPSHLACHPVTYGSKSPIKADHVGSLKFKMTGNEPYKQCRVRLYATEKCDGLGRGKDNGLASQEFRGNSRTASWYKSTWYKINVTRRNTNASTAAVAGSLVEENVESGAGKPASNLLGRTRAAALARCTI
jgi:hypothetical protein